jgi:hypothetical protein
MDDKLCANGCGQRTEAKKPRGKAPIYCGDICRKEARAKYLAAYKAAYYAQNRALYAERGAGRYAKHKTHILATNAKWREKHPGYMAKCAAQFHAAHPTYNAEYMAQYRASPQGKAVLREAHNQRRARQLAAFSEPIDSQIVFERDEGLCGLCGEPVDPDNWDLDHAIPLGPGDHTYENLQVSHPSCNKAKIGSDKRVLAEWRMAA